MADRAVVPTEGCDDPGQDDKLALVGVILPQGM